MKLLSTVFILFTISHSFGQVTDSIKPYSFVAGITVSNVFSSNEVRRYELMPFEGGSYYDVSSNRNSSLLYRFDGEFQYDYLFVRFGLGMRNETINLEAHNYQEYYHFAFSQSYNAEVQRDIKLNKKHTTGIASFRIGSYLFDKTHAFRIGFSAGVDFCARFQGKSTGPNQLFLEETRKHPSLPGISETTSDTHVEGSTEWNETLREAGLSSIVPVLSMRTSYRLHERLSISANAQLRFLTLTGRTNKRSLVLESPVGIGVHYHF